MSERILNAITSRPWLITQDGLELILSVVRREADIEAVEARLGRPLQNAQSVSVRDGVAVLPVVGPIARRANLFSRISGATSIELLARDLTAALDDPSVRGIVLDIDSPGGEANGVNEFAEMIYQARQRKPVVAYVGGYGASAAYWIASAATEVVVDATAAVGSIGVIAALPAQGVADEMTFTSRKSPRKRPDHLTTEGRDQIQDLIDAMYDVFVQSVARNRGVTTADVINDFGEGGMFVGQDAVKAGLADRVGSLEGVIAELQGQPFRPTVQMRISEAMPAEQQRITLTPRHSAAPVAARAIDAPPLPAPPPSTTTENTMTTHEEGRAPEPVPVPAPEPPTLAPPPVPVMADAQMQAQLAEYAAQMQAHLQAQMREQYETALRQSTEQARLQFERWRAEQQQQQEIRRFAQDVTTATIDRMHALPVTADALEALLLETPGAVRPKWQALLEQINTAGLVSFEEIGSSAEGQEERTAEEAFNDAVRAAMKGGLSRLNAIQKVQREQPELYAAYSAESSGRHSNGQRNGKGGR